MSSDTVNKEEQNKTELRRWARARRRALDMPTLSAYLVARIRTLPEFERARHVLLYLPLRDEVDVQALIESGGARRTYLPRCAEDFRLAIHPYIPGETPIRTGAFGVREPDPGGSEEADAALLDLVIVPGLLFTPDCERMGYGAGHYDRFLPRLSPDCRCIAAAPDALIVPHLPTDAWDRPMDAVVTETHVYRR